MTEKGWAKGGILSPLWLPQATVRTQEWGMDQLTV